MTIEEFNNTKFSIHDWAIYKGAKYKIASVDFEEQLIGLLMNNDPENPKEISWVRCENAELAFPLLIQTSNIDN